MSNRIKIKKHKVKTKDPERNTEIPETKANKGFMKSKREKGTITNFSGKSAKEYSRKKV